MSRRPPTRRVLMLLSVGVAVSCSGSDGDGGERQDGRADDGRASDAADVDADGSVLDDLVTATDAAGDDARDGGDGTDGEARGAPHPGRCAPLPPPLGEPTGPRPWAPNEHAGIDRWERSAWEALLETVPGDPGVHFLATWSHEREAYVVVAGPPDDRDRLVYRRDAEDGEVAFEVVEGSVQSIFPATDPSRHGSYDAMLDALANPNDVPPPESKGYAADDRRWGFLPAAAQSYPHALERLAAAFDAPDAPDFLVGLQPWTGGGGGSHGAMSLLQSRASLLLSGPGARDGVVLDRAATLPDVAPTVLAALGAPATEGVGPAGAYDDGLMLRRQDGRVLREALAEDPCDRAEHALVVLFDGLQAHELAHQVLDGDASAEVPTFRELADEGVLYRHGAISGFPSVSAPGHMTVASGLWPGRHGIVANQWYRRSSGETIDPFTLLENPLETAENPEQARAIYERAVSDEAGTMAAAVHRAFGDWTPESAAEAEPARRDGGANGTGTPGGEGAFTAVFNEIGIGGADWTTIGYLAHGPVPTPERAISAEQAELLDDFGVMQVEEVVPHPDTPVPTLLQTSLVVTDTVGAQAGPHSEPLRSVLEDTDERLASILDAYESVGALDDTLVVLVADHGMELQDPSRGHELGARIAEAGVRLRRPHRNLGYLRTLEIDGEATPEGLAVRVRDHDDGAPLPDVSVGCPSCGAEVATDAEGRATLQPEASEEPVTVTAEHPDYNPQSHELSL